MKREWEPSDGITKIWPIFFWRLCWECKREFRRTHGWDRIVGPYFGGTGNLYFVCSDCAPDRIQAAAVFEEIENPADA